jgi:hypothetical protein
MARITAAMIGLAGLALLLLLPSRALIFCQRRFHVTSPYELIFDYANQTV